MKRMATRTKPRFPQLHDFLYKAAYCLLLLGFITLFLFQLGA